MSTVPTINYSTEYFNKKANGLIYLAPMVVMAAAISLRDLFGFNLFEGTIFENKQAILVSHFIVVFGLPFLIISIFQNLEKSGKENNPYLMVTEKGITLYRNSEIFVSWENLAEIKISKVDGDDCLTICRNAGQDLDVRIDDLSINSDEIIFFVEEEIMKYGVKFSLI